MESLRDNEALPHASKLNLREDFLRILLDAGITREGLRLPCLLGVRFNLMLLAFCVHSCLGTTLNLSAHGVQKRASDPREVVCKWL